ncbi:MAG: hypothetical protein AAFN81_25415 [Bacteroidota bacterium]
MKGFLIDATILPIKEKADAGEINAILEIFNAFSSGKNAAHDFSWAKAYGEKILEYYPKIIYCYKDPNRIVCYSSIFYILGEMEKFDGNYHAARKWYQKAIDYADNDLSSKPFVMRKKIYRLLNETRKMIWQKRIEAIKTLLGDLYIKLFWKRYKWKMEHKVN